MVDKNMKNTKGAGAKPTVWKHGGRGRIASIYVPKVSKQLIHKIGIIIDHDVTDNPSYDKAKVLMRIEKLLP